MEATTAEVEILETVKKRFPDAVADSKVQRKGRITLKVRKESMVEVARFLKETCSFDHIVSVSATEYPPRKEFEVVYHVWSISSRILLALKTSIPVDKPEVETLIPVWDGANLHERETHEMFGINFNGHPNLTRLLLPEDWDGPPPLRKDFKLPSEAR